jgi:hypothetical protein
MALSEESEAKYLAKLLLDLVRELPAIPDVVGTHDLVSVATEQIGGLLAQFTADVTSDIEMLELANWLT